MLDIGFIFPSSDYLHDPFRGDPHTHFYILTILESRFGSKVNLCLIDLRGIKREFAIYHIPKCDVYLHSVYTLDYKEQKSIVNNLRIRYPDAKHIAGGPHATFFEEESLKTFDSLILGEGEESIVRAVQDIMNSKLQRVYRQNTLIDINLYPYSNRKYLVESSIARKGLLTMKTREGYDQLLSTTVMFSRGCPFGCRFCAMPQIQGFAPGIRYRSPELVQQEIEYLKRDYKVEAVSFLDDITIPLDPKKAIPHLEAIGRTGIIWKGQSRVDGINPEIIKIARDAGCVAIGMGVESVSQRPLDIIDKRIRVDQAKRAIAILKENGIECRIYLIMGLPGEPEDIVDQTWSFIKETDPDMVYLSVFTVRPGTEVFSNPKKFGIKWVNTDWEKTMHMFGRYEEEMPSLTFEYDEVTPWGKSFSNERLINNYLEIKARIEANGYSSAINKKALV